VGHPSDVAALLFALSQSAQLNVPFLPLFEENKKVNGKAEGHYVTPGTFVPSERSCRDRWDKVESPTSLS